MLIMKMNLLRLSILLIALYQNGFAITPEDDTAASPYQDELQLAAGLYETQEFSHATNLYQELLKNPLSDWQKSVVLYNMGSIALADKNNDRAIKILKSVPLGEESSPLLTYRTQANLALAYWNKAQSLSQLNAVTRRNEDFGQIAELFNSSLEAIAAAQEAHCTLEKIEGNTACSPVSDLSQLKEEIQRQLDALPPLTEPRTGAGQTQPNPSGTETKAETTIPEKGTSAMDQVLRLLLEMEAQDASSTTAPNVSNKGALRPW